MHQTRRAAIHNDVEARRSGRCLSARRDWTIHEHILHQHRIEKLLVVNGDYELRGLITVKDIQKKLKYPNASKDEQGRLRVGGAIGATGDFLERAAELAARRRLGLYDALFVQLARELELPLLISDVKLARAAEGTIRVELLQAKSS